MVDVAALVLTGIERVVADVFVDACGFGSVIAQAALGVRFVPFADKLFCDRAVTLPSPREAGARLHRRASSIQPARRHRLVMRQRRQHHPT
ncbi:tryptophan 7-halogenase [Sphingomonas sp. Mn802worker]|uniref:tryptophan 7-halogenase n=1 Tax=Sphingomonas sp. Mn802worker TaxID=629773 RepID=UPI00039C910C|nr:tryptophan 7-halogenase [Sphingomonas sp. Mn802worker]